MAVCLPSVVRLIVVNPSFFQQHLPLNHLMDIDQSPKELSLGSPVLKLYKRFKS
jgi:hypothetical protein